MLKGKTLLVTGGTGSFGQAVVNKFLESDLREIRIFSRDEKKQYDMRKKYASGKLKFYIGDVRNYSSIDFALKGVDYVFHAAALKQVPSCEFFPMEAIMTNVIGAENVLRASVVNNVKKIVVLSTDKAVYPINAMGISKALMEKVMIAESRDISGTSNTIMCGTRYGNVMASRGSVIPLFVELAKQNKDITITNPNMTRFLMSLEESVELVEFAFANAKAGDIFVQKAPAATIKDLAIAIKELFNSESNLEYIGMRHGEKVHETLLSREEKAKSLDMDKFYRVPADVRDLNYNKFFSEGDCRYNEVDDYTSENTERLTVEEIKELLLKLDYIQESLRK